MLTSFYVIDLLVRTSEFRSSLLCVFLFALFLYANAPITVAPIRKNRVYSVYNEKGLDMLYPFSLRQITWASIDSAVMLTSTVCICSSCLSFIV